MPPERASGGRAGSPIPAGSRRPAGRQHRRRGALHSWARKPALWAPTSEGRSGKTSRVRPSWRRHTRDRTGRREPRPRWHPAGPVARQLRRSPPRPRTPRRAPGPGTGRPPAPGAQGRGFPKGCGVTETAQWPCGRGTQPAGEWARSMPVTAKEAHGGPREDTRPATLHQDAPRRRSHIPVGATRVGWRGAWVNGGDRGFPRGLNARGQLPSSQPQGGHTPKARCLLPCNANHREARGACSLRSSFTPIE